MPISPGFKNAGRFDVSRSRPLRRKRRRTDGDWPLALGAVDIDSRVNTAGNDSREEASCERPIALLVREVV